MLPLTVQSVSVVVPALCQAAAERGGGVAADGAVGQRGRPLVVQAAAVYRSLAAGDRQSREGRRDAALTWNTRLGPPPLTVTPAAGPVIVCVPLVLVSSSWVPVRVIVCGVAKTVGSKVIGGAGERSARLTAWGRVRVPGGAADVGGVLTTSEAAWIWKAPMSTVLVAAGRPRWSVVMARPVTVVAARADGRAAGQQGHGLGRPAVVAQRCQQGVERTRRWCPSGRIDPARSAVGLADQVVRAARERCR